MNTYSKENASKTLLFKFENFNKSITISEEGIEEERFVFLDVDGVINLDTKLDAELDAEQIDRVLNEKIPNLDELLKIASKHILFTVLNFDLSAVARVIQLCEDTGAKIVLSSDWREGSSVESLKLIFDICGLGKYIVDKTGHYYSSSQGYLWRGELIWQWIHEHKKEKATFVVIDDQEYDFKIRYLQDYFVHCPHMFTEECFQKAKNILLNKPLSEELIERPRLA